MRDREPQSKQRARPGCGYYVRWSYQALPPAEPQHSFPLLPRPGAPTTWAFISRAKYPRSLQSLSFLASRQSDNYLFSFPLLVASREVFWLALVCMKYYQNIAHFSILQPLTQEIWSYDWQVSVFHVPLRITALFWSYSKNFDGRRNECVPAFVTYSVGVKELTDFMNLNSSGSFPHGKTYQHYNRAASSSPWILWGFWKRRMSKWHTMPRRGRHLKWIWSETQEPSSCLILFIPISKNVQQLWIRRWVSFTTEDENLHSA